MAPLFVTTTSSEGKESEGKSFPTVAEVNVEDVESIDGAAAMESKGEGVERGEGEDGEEMKEEGEAEEDGEEMREEGEKSEEKDDRDTDGREETSNDVMDRAQDDGVSELDSTVKGDTTAHSEDDSKTQKTTEESTDIMKDAEVYYMYTIQQSPPILILCVCLLLCPGFR